MTFSVSGSLLDACVLGVLSRSDTYGYDITQRLMAEADVSESTLYPVLRRLSGSGLLETYDMPFDGRNRRYYRLTPIGLDALKNYICEWETYQKTVDNLLKGGNTDEQN